MIPDQVACKRVLFNMDLVMDIRRSKDMFVQGDCDKNVRRLCRILGWEDELVEQNSKTRIGEKSKEDENATKKKEKDS